MIAYKTYSQVANPDGIPGNWPALCKDLKSDGSAVDGTSLDNAWTVCSVSAYSTYLAANRAQYDAWAVTFVPTPAPGLKEGL